MSVRIAVIGSGYVGLVSGACFADIGHDVICVDRDMDKIESIREGRLPIYEPGLDDLVRRNVQSGRLSFSTDTAASVRDREAVFIAVGTPSDAQSGQAELTYVFAAAAEVGAAIESSAVIVVKSTVPVGTNGKVAEMVARQLRPGAAFTVASNPEFLREGAAINDFLEPDRIVVGCGDEATTALMRRIYAPLIATNTPFVVTDVATAEMIKYAANAFLAIKVSFINEISDLCEVLGANVRNVSLGIGLDKRIGTAFLRPGPGWGGSCFPKDTRALISIAREQGLPITTVEAATKANANRKAFMARRVSDACGGSVRGKTIGVLGLTFKGQTDDMRDSPSLDILPGLVDQGAKVVAFDPSRPVDAPRLLPAIVMVDSALKAAEGADVLVVMTDWGVFATYDLGELAGVMREPVLVDLRNLFDRTAVLKAGFRIYEGLGNACGTL